VLGAAVASLEEWLSVSGLRDGALVDPEEDNSAAYLKPPERTLTEFLDPCPSDHHFWRITMTTNVGAIDRTVRIVIGPSLIAGAAPSTIGLWG